MPLPNTLKGFSMFADGYGFAGKLAAGMLPKLSLKIVEHRDGGMDINAWLEGILDPNGRLSPRAGP